MSQRLWPMVQLFLLKGFLCDPVMEEVLAFKIDNRKSNNRKCLYLLLAAGKISSISTQLVGYTPV